MPPQQSWAEMELIKRETFENTLDSSSSMFVPRLELFCPLLILQTPIKQQLLAGDTPLTSSPLTSRASLSVIVLSSWLLRMNGGKAQGAGKRSEVFPTTLSWQRLRVQAASTRRVSSVFL